ncbi:granulin 1 [Hoplias malabaricus]|uniref:granulin 1 n=1 Tax=Hoplias malabaricus TaxID=27720 RepID=UPI003462C2C0
MRALFLETMIAVLVLLLAALVSSDVICPDGKHCDDNNTCCPTDTGYGCCNYPNAVCCSDKVHCCPQDYVCDTKSMHCVKEGLPWYSIPMSPQKTAKEQKETNPVSSPSVVYCDSYHTCPDGTTCCRSPQGIWSCCIYNIGQCCPDGFHCCPYGYYCDITSTRCLRGALSLPALHIPATLNKQDQCCLSEEGCCPHGFRCDEKSRACVSDLDENSPVVPLKQALDREVQDEVIRCNGRFYCPSAHTCCKTPTGDWGCCPYPLGQCCKDGKHCCEFGFNCDATYSNCTKGYTRIPAGTKKNAQFL